MLPYDAYDCVFVLLSRTGKGRIGVTDYLNVDQRQLSMITFQGSVEGDVDLEGPHRQAFRLGNQALACQHYNYPDRPSVWIAHCDTGPGRRGLAARFVGREADLAAFYDIVGGIRPVQ
jgi:hypothetical protein